MKVNTPETAPAVVDKTASDVLGPDEVAPIVAPLPPVDKPTEIQSSEITDENSSSNITDANIEDHILSVKTQYEGFDPSVHASNEDGTPKFKADGSYAKKRGRKPLGAISDPLPVNQTAQTTPQAPNSTVASSAPEIQKAIDYTALGKVYAGLFFGGTSSIIGPEWLPRDKDEQKHVETAFAAYAKSTGASDLPPGWALVLTLGMYSASRMQHENTRGKFAKLKEKAVFIVGWLKGRMGK